MTHIQNILVPVDFSDCSRRAAEYAISLAKDVGATVTLEHVYSLPFTAYPEGFARPPETLTRLGEQARESLERWKDGLKEPGVIKRTICEVGAPAQTIVDRAATDHFDLVVMGTHGRTGLTHLLVGSVAERVVRLAPCPVLTVRGEATPSA
jgi:nucleotide-binding universal stress UspA family protein